MCIGQNGVSFDYFPNAQSQLSLFLIGMRISRFRKFHKNNGDVGIRHETYKIDAGNYECIYNNMPKYGLGKVAELIPAIGRRESTADRILTNKF